MATDPMQYKRQADAALQRAADQLQQVLQDACAELDPFPPFPNAFFTNAIECDIGNAGDPELGCVVVAEDGNLYELQIGLDRDAIELTGSWDPVTARKEEKRAIDLTPHDYILYGYAGLTAVLEHLLEQQADREHSADA